MVENMKADIKWLDDPEVFRVGVLPAHSDHRFYQNEQEMEKEENSLAQSLNGVWKFCYSKNPASRPMTFYEPGFDESGFDEIKVPCHIEMAGYDKIHYINNLYPWEGKIYRRPAYTLSEKHKWQGMFSEASYNPVGSYIRKFDLNKELRGKRVVICFEGVEQAMYLWLNGVFIGYAEDSFTPSEFDLTPYLKEEGNVLAAEVYKQSTAAFLEDQDFFRFSGIFRNVTLYAKPQVHVEDMWAQPELLNDGSGRLSLDVSLSVKKGCFGWAEAELMDENEALCLKQQLTIEDGKETGEKIKADRVEEKTDEYEKAVLVMKSAIVEKVQSWDNHSPYLYKLLIRLYDEKGELVEIVPYRIGFRKIEIKNKVIYLNDKRLIINGVNRHEWSAESGRCISVQEMEQDMECILANNINAVRTCHYPDQIPWYYMCDKKGVYLMAETNLESHGSWQTLTGNNADWNVPGSVPEWKEVVLDRAKNNFETFKNHVSILFWSLGNESYAGDNIEAMNYFFKEKDRSRLVHYEGVAHNRNYEDTISDVESRMYATPEQIEEYLTHEPKKPFILCEYMHDMGNSLGGMDSYIKLLDKYEMYQGGFIWDFIDQAVFVQDEATGRKVLRYGGDFDDRPSNYEFSGNGILFADRTEKPAMQEVRYYYGLYK